MTNQMGDVIAIADKNGDLVAAYRYDAWGNVEAIETLYENNEYLLEIANANPLRYRGYYYDNETGYYYLQSRYYDPSICRFINADMFDIAQASKDISNRINIFAYCCNNPINYSDPNGCLKIPNWVKIAIGVGGIAAAVIATVASGGTALPALVAILKKVAGTMAINMAIEGVIGYIVAGKSGIKQGLIDGAINGFMWGGIASAISALGKIISFNKCGSFKSGKCFVAGTLVSTENGLIPIEEIKTGDKVYSTESGRDEIDLKNVSKTFVNFTSELVHIKINGTDIVSTKEHPYYVNNYGWVKAESLNAGDELLTSEGKIEVVESVNIEILDKPVEVYNFEVEDFHTYFVSDSKILVHNACGFNNKRVLNEIKIKKYKVSMDVERGGSGLVNIHVKVNGTKYFWKNGKFLSKAGAQLPKQLRNNEKIINALKKAIKYMGNGQI